MVLLNDLVLARVVLFFVVPTKMKLRSGYTYSYNPSKAPGDGCALRLSKPHAKLNAVAGHCRPETPKESPPALGFFSSYMQHAKSRVLFDDPDALSCWLHS